MSLKATEVLMKLSRIGMTGVNINTTLDADTAKILASEFGWEVEDVAVSEEQAIEAARARAKTAAGRGASVELAPAGRHRHGSRRPRQDVAARQDPQGQRRRRRSGRHHAAHRRLPGEDAERARSPSSTRPVTRRSPPMRARGAEATDIVILVVAADDGVMPQTKEAIAHAKAAKVPIIVAINKIDKPGAEPERVKRELVELGLQPEEWGGDTIFCEVSAQDRRTASTQLLEMIALQAEVLELKANPKKPATGTVIEALLDRGRGPVARVLVQDGTLQRRRHHPRRPRFGKVRAMTDEHGKQVHEARPGHPGRAPRPRRRPERRRSAARREGRRRRRRRSPTAARPRCKKPRSPASAKVSLEDLAKRMAEADQLELRLIIKADVQGSVEAVADALAKLSTEKVKRRHHPRRRRRHHRGRHQPRGRVEGDRHRLQRSPGRQGRERSPKAKASRSASTTSSTTPSTT